MTIANMEFQASDRLRRAMRAKGFSVEGLANELEVSRNTISALLNDRAEMDKRTALALQVVLGVSSEWLRNGTGTAELSPARTGAALRASFVGTRQIRNWCTPRDLNPEPTVLGSVPNTAEELFSLWDSLERSAVR